ncbi:MAG: hypothetical protein ACD_48C00389G0004 [uncultured bacterium]|nr:MAG: hypothetical protein ACD_48C00389G0004 [uncultured bacterium]
MILWDIYEISSPEELLHNVKARGKIRKFSISINQDLIIENASDIENTVRFGVPAGADVKQIASFITTIFPTTKVTLVKEKTMNPVLSKLLINDIERYSII